jgi:hypothetical protein
LEGLVAFLGAFGEDFYVALLFFLVFMLFFWIALGFFLLGFGGLFGYFRIFVCFLNFNLFNDLRG